jgi:hypothetical protein
MTNSLQALVARFTVAAAAGEPCDEPRAEPLDKPRAYSLAASGNGTNTRPLSPAPELNQTAFAQPRSSIPNTLLKRDSPTSLRITHPAHPLKGQILTVLPMVGAKLDPTHFLVGLPDGEQQLIPAEWTDRVTPPRTLPGALFLFERLLRLRQRLDALIADEGNPAILSVHKLEHDRNGGSDVDPRSPDSLDTDEPRPASPAYGHPGRNAVAPMEPGNGGAA